MEEESSPIQAEIPREVNPVNYAFYTIEDALLRARHGLSYLELQAEIKKDDKSGDPFLGKYLKDAQSRAADILGLGRGWNSDYAQEWKALPSEDRENFLDWLAKKDDDFRIRYEDFLAEIAPFAPSPTAAQEIQDHSDREQMESYRIYEERRKEAEELPDIEGMSEVELRQEIIRHINETLGKLAQGPLVDGTGAFGFRREWDSKKEYDRGIMLPLICSYVRFTKAYDADEQSGIRLELLGLMRKGEMYVDLKDKLEEKARTVDQMTRGEREDFDKFKKEMESQKEAVERDGLAPADNRYYFIPVKDNEQAIVSTESDITRASRANPDTTDRLLGEDMVSEAEREDTKPIDPETGLPRQRTATLQDLQDAAVIVRGYKNFVKDSISITPKNNWGRPGLTE